MILDTKHIILTATLVGTLLGGVYLFESNRADKAEAKAESAQATAQLLNQQNKDFQLSVNSQLAALTAQNQQLALALSQRQVLEVKVPQQNASLTAAQVSTALDTATGNKVGTTVAQGDTLILPTALGKDALSALQLVPLLQADKANLTTENINLSKSLDLEKQAHTSDITACQATVTSAQAEVKAVKAQARKSKFKIFFIGYAAGFITQKLLFK